MIWEDPHDMILLRNVGITLGVKVSFIKNFGGLLTHKIVF